MKEIFCIGDWGDLVSSETIEFFKDKKKFEYYLLGDNFYPVGVNGKDDSQWKEKFQKLFPKISKKYACLGNHDYLGDVFSQIQMTFTSDNANWNLPYFFHDVVDEKHGTHTFFIDTQILATDITVFLSKSCGMTDKKLQEYLSMVYQLKEKQVQWLHEKLESSQSKWKIICGHYPVISNGPHQISQELQDIMLPIIDKYNVDIYVSGHEHNTQCILKNKCLFLVSGGIYATNPYNIKSLTNNTIFYSSENGVISLYISKNRLHVCFYDIVKNKEKFLYHKQKN